MGTIRASFSITLHVEDAELSPEQALALLANVNTMQQRGQVEASPSGRAELAAPVPQPPAFQALPEAPARRPSTQKPSAPKKQSRKEIECPPAQTREPYIAKGRKISKLTALEDAVRSTDKIRFQCECGTIKQILANSVKSQVTKACGCSRRNSTNHLFPKRSNQSKPKPPATVTARRQEMSDDELRRMVMGSGQ